MRNNPDGRTLAGILPAELYERWSILKERHIGSDRGIERLRPIFAAGELYTKALHQSELESNSMVFDVIGKLAKRHEVATTSTGITRTIEDPRAAVKRFKRSAIDDVGCFASTVERLETDLPAMQARALAWTSGDLSALRALPYVDQQVSCIDAVFDSAFGAELASATGLVDVERQLRDNWTSAAVDALDNNAVSFVILPIAEMLKPDGYLAVFGGDPYTMKRG